MEAYFIQKEREFDHQAQGHQRAATRYAWARGFVFLIVVLCVILFFQTKEWMLAVVGLGGLFVFLFCVIRSQYHGQQATFFQVSEALAKEELQRLGLKLSGLDEGARFLQPNHPYAQDLDIFGQHSVYQLVNRASLPESQDVLAGWLSSVPIKAEWTLRQQAVQELAGMPDWMMHFLATIRWTLSAKRDKRDAVSANDLSDWALRKTPGPVNVFWGVGLLLGLITIATLLLGLMGVVSFTWLYAELLVNMIFLGLSSRYLTQIQRGLDRARYLLITYEQALHLVVQSSWRSEKLKAFQLELKEQGAQKAIAELVRLSNRIDARANMFYWVLNVPLLLDVHLLRDLHRWKDRYGQTGLHWIQTIHQMEALVSVGAFAHAHPAYGVPEWSEDDFVVEGVGLGHPLIPDNQRVCNDYSLLGAGHIDVLTGSNMSGKSTFQRTLGVNLILAYLGAPVCAQKFTFSGMQVFTSMRTRDSLEAHASSFYAELRRIQILLNLVTDGQPVFFLLDELLKGTNSADRHQGSVALITKLGRAGAMGLVSTHDLSLGELASQLSHVRNYSFNSSVSADQIVFDYKLSEGVCRSFNATQLMRNMGILN